MVSLEYIAFEHNNAAAELASRVDAVAEGKQLDFGQDYPAEPKRDSK